MNELILRDASLNDISALVTLIQSAFAEYEGVLDPPSGAHSENADKIREKMSHGGALIAYVDDKRAGCVLFYPENGFLYLGRLAVLPEFRGAGIGHALVSAVEQKASELHLPGVQLGVRVALPQNRAFFELLGYRVISYGYHPGYPQPTFITLEKRVLS